MIKQKHDTFLYIGFLIFLVVTAALYAMTFSYFNYLESSVANISQYWLRGHPLYTDLVSQDRYSLLYGPWPFMANALFQLPNIAVIQASKMLGLLNLFMTLSLFWTLLRRRSLSLNQSFKIIGILCIALLGFDNFSYVNRPDSFLITYTVGALYLLEVGGDKFVFWILSGALMGLAIACKAHSAFYFVPIFIFYFEKKEKRISPFLLSTALITGGITSLLPFLFPTISLPHYLIWLRSTSQHGLTLRLFTDNLSYLIPYFLALYYLGFAQQFKKTFIALALSSFIICILGSLVGAGTHHLIPFLPLLIYFGALSYFSNREKKSALAGVFFTSLIIALVYDGFISQKAILNYFKKIPLQIEQYNELQTLQEKYLGPLELGYGDNSQLEWSYYKPYIIARQGSLLVDASALMDMGFSKVDIPPSTIDALEKCRVPTMILPLGETQWRATSGFGLKLFSEKWISVFMRKYKPVESSKFYTVYKCF